MGDSKDIEISRRSSLWWTPRNETVSLNVRRIPIWFLNLACVSVIVGSGDLGFCWIQETHAKVVWSVIQKMQWVFLNVLLHLRPHIPHMLPVKAQRFFPEMVQAVPFEAVWAAAGGSVVLSQQHCSELTFSRYQPTGPLVSEEEINHILQKHPTVLNSPIDRWLSVSGNI